MVNSEILLMFIIPRELSVSLTQIYLDNIMDLLNPTGEGLAIREDPVHHFYFCLPLISIGNEGDIHPRPNFGPC